MNNAIVKRDSAGTSGVSEVAADGGAGSGQGVRHRSGARAGHGYGFGPGWGYGPDPQYFLESPTHYGAPCPARKGGMSPAATR